MNNNETPEGYLPLPTNTATEGLSFLKMLQLEISVLE